MEGGSLGDMAARRWAEWARQGSHVAPSPAPTLPGTPGSSTPLVGTSLALLGEVAALRAEGASVAAHCQRDRPNFPDLGEGFWDAVSAHVAEELKGRDEALQKQTDEITSQKSWVQLLDQRLTVCEAHSASLGELLARYSFLADHKTLVDRVERLEQKEAGDLSAVRGYISTLQQEANVNRGACKEIVELEAQALHDHYGAIRARLARLECLAESGQLGSQSTASQPSQRKRPEVLVTPPGAITTAPTTSAQAATEAEKEMEEEHEQDGHEVALERLDEQVRRLGRELAQATAKQGSDLQAIASAHLITAKEVDNLRAQQDELLSKLSLLSSTVNEASDAGRQQPGAEPPAGDAAAREADTTPKLWRQPHAGDLPPAVEALSTLTQEEPEDWKSEVESRLRSIEERCRSLGESFGKPQAMGEGVLEQRMDGMDAQLELLSIAASRNAQDLAEIQRHLEILSRQLRQ